MSTRNHVKWPFDWAALMQLGLCVLIFLTAAVIARGDVVLNAPQGFRSPTQAMWHTLATNGAAIVSFQTDSRGSQATVHLEPGYDYMILHERTLEEHWTALYSRVFVTWNNGTQGGYVMRVLEPETRIVRIPKSQMRSGFYKLVKKETIPQ